MILKLLNIQHLCVLWQLWVHHTFHRKYESIHIHWPFQERYICAHMCHSNAQYWECINGWTIIGNCCPHKSLYFRSWRSIINNLIRLTYVVWKKIENKGICVCISDSFTTSGGQKGTAGLLQLTCQSWFKKLQSYHLGYFEDMCILKFGNK